MVKSPLVSDDLVWLCVRNHSSFLVKRNGVQFTSEPNNIASLNNFKYSGLANSKSVGIETDGSGNVVLTSVTTKKDNKPSNMQHKVSLRAGRGPKRNNKTITSAVGKYYYRPDLLKMALAKNTRVSKTAARKSKGVKPTFREKRGKK